MLTSESSIHFKVSNGIDRISNLPQPLLSHILSLLPTKNAVATSVLSTRWKFLWTSITNLDFCSLEHDWRKPFETKNNLQMKRDKFTLFVNRVLLLLNPTSIQSFRLKCYQDCFDPLYLNSWIAISFGRTIREFKLSLILKEPVELPLSHIYCNVTVLKLDGNIRFRIPAAASVCFQNLQALHLSRITSVIASNSSLSFPNLKIMQLSYVKFADEDSVLKLFSSSPVLDDLIIERTDRSDKIFCLIIRIPSLTRLSTDFQFFDYDHMYKIQIDTPALRYLNLSDQFPFEYLPADNLSSLVQANVNIHISDEDEEHVEIHNSIIKFIGNLSKVKFLSISGGVLKVFENASTNISPSFHNLVWLVIKVYDCLDFSVMLDNFLESMDNLKHLVMEGQKESQYGGCLHPYRWSEPQNVAKCLHSRVTTISFNYMIVDCCYQLKLLRYILKNAEVLQKLTIGTDHITSEKKQLEMVKKISLIPRGSRVCQVEFT